MYLTYSEIKDQYKALKKTLDCVEAAVPAARELLDRLQPGKLVFFGCGSSYSLAKSMALAAQLHLGMPALALPAGDYILHDEEYGPWLKGALAVVVSRSGSTSEAVRAVETLKAAGGAGALTLCCAEGTPLEALSDLTIAMPWCYDRSVCQTRTVSCLYAAGMALIAGLAGDSDLLAGLARVAADGNNYLKWYEEELKFAAGKGWTHAVVLADAEIAGIAEEGSLAFKEICQKPSNFYHLLDSRHGPMVLIGRETLVIAALSSGAKLELDLLADVAAKGAQLIVYSDTPVAGLPERALNVSFGSALPHGARGLALVLICQLLAYWRAVQDGTNPDEPSGLDPWIKL